MSSTWTKVGHGFAWFFNLNLDPYGQREAERNDSRDASQSHPDVEPYEERDPTAADWLVSVVPTPRAIIHYFYRLFPFLHWITRYNLTWFIGDLIAGKFGIHSTAARVKTDVVRLKVSPSEP